MLRTKPQHGGLPVSLLPRGYRLTHADGTHVDYPNARRLLMALHGGRDPGLSFDRYFRQGRFDPMRRCPVLNLGALRRQAERLRKPRGVDLARRGGEVAKLLRKACGQSIYTLGYDFDDVLQEVYKGILSRNRGPGAFDPERSSFGFYVTMVCRCVFANYHKREQRRHGRERPGAWAYQDEGWVPVDAGEVAICGPWDNGDLYLAEVGECMEDLSEFIADQEGAWRQDATLYQDARLAREVLPLVYSGKRRGEIAVDLGVSAPAVGRALAYLRDAAREWVSLRVLH